MPLFSQIVSKISPSFLRGLRLNVFMDLSRIRSALPECGAIIELGCGYGHISSRLAELYPEHQFVGLDIDEKAIDAARHMWRRPNLRFEIAGQPTKPGALVLLLHVIHHVPDEHLAGVISQAAGLLKERGRLLVEEMDAGHCGFGVFLDTHVSHSPPIVRDEAQLRALLAPHFEVVGCERFRKTQIGRVRLLAEKRE